MQGRRVEAGDACGSKESDRGEQSVKLFTDKILSSRFESSLSSEKSNSRTGQTQLTKILWGWLKSTKDSFT